MDKALDNLRAEVNVLQRDEQTKLESQKREILDRINQQVTDLYQLLFIMLL